MGKELLKDIPSVNELLNHSRSKLEEFFLPARRLCIGRLGRISQPTPFLPEAEEIRKLSMQPS